MGKDCLAAIPYTAVVLPRLMEAGIVKDMAALYHDLGGRGLPETVAECEKALTALISKKAGRWAHKESLMVDIQHRYGYLRHQLAVVVTVGQYSIFEVRYLAALKETHPEKYEIASLLLKALWLLGGMPVWSGAEMLDSFWPGYGIDEIVEESGLEREYLTSLFEESKLIDDELLGLPRDMTIGAVLRKVKEMLHAPIPFTPAQQRWIRNSIEILSLAEKDRKDHFIRTLHQGAVEFEDTTDPVEFFMFLWSTDGPIATEYDDHLEMLSSSGIDVPVLAYSPKSPTDLKALDRLCRMFRLLQRIFWEGGREWKEE